MYNFHLRIACTLDTLDKLHAILNRVQLVEYIGREFVHHIPHITKTFAFLENKKNEEK